MHRETRARWRGRKREAFGGELEATITRKRGVRQEGIHQHWEAYKGYVDPLNDIQATCW